MNKISMLQWAISSTTENLVGEFMIKDIEIVNGKILYLGEELEQYSSSSGYKFVVVNGDILHVHRIIAEKLVVNTNESLNNCVNHKDGDKENNSPDNLEWVNHSYNLYHSYHMIGRDVIKSSVDEEVIHEICKLVEQGFRNKEIRVIYPDLPKTFLAELRSGRTYKNISKKYKMRSDRAKRLSEGKVRWVCRKLEEGLSSTEISRLSKGKIDVMVIDKIKSRDNFKAITKDYKF